MMPPRPFDHETMKTKTTWSDEELREDIKKLKKAIEAVDKLGDRYDLVIFDLRWLLNTRLSMAQSRGLQT